MKKVLMRCWEELELLIPLFVVIGVAAGFGALLQWIANNTVGM